MGLLGARLGGWLLRHSLPSWDVLSDIFDRVKYNHGFDVDKRKVDIISRMQAHKDN